MSSPLVFSGPVAAALTRYFPCGLRLRGPSGPARTPTVVDIAADLDSSARRRLSQEQVVLKDVALEPGPGSGDWTLRCADGEWTLHAARVFIHQDLTAPFVELVPPRPAPLGKRLFWRAVLWLMSHPGGRDWLLRRYGR